MVRYVEVTRLLEKEISMSEVRTAEKGQVPGYYRLRVGDLMITALYDGYLDLSPNLFHGIEQEQMLRLIRGKFQPQNKDGVETAVTTYLIDDGKELTLLNTGGAKRVGQTMGNITRNLLAAGYFPEKVTNILLTHMHFDHICGLVHEDGTPVFTNARVFASETESDFWLDPKAIQSAPAESKAFFEMAVSSIAPYKERGKFNMFKDSEEVLPGIHAVPTPGHTPGHTSFLITSGTEKILLWGDIIHSHAIQFDHPEVSNDFDTDQAQAIESRQNLFQRVITEELLVGGDHLPFPGFGHVVKNDSEYSWIPVEYATL